VEEFVAQKTFNLKSKLYYPSQTVQIIAQLHQIVSQVP